MSKTSILTGNPWHVEKMVREEGDDRRHRTYCRNYNKECKRCSYYLGDCRGAAHCSHYIDNRVSSQRQETVENNSHIKSQGVAKPYEPNIQIVPPRKPLCKQAEGVTINTCVVHKQYGIGYVYRFDKEKKHVYVDFPAGVKAFIFPDIFEMGILKKK